MKLVLINDLTERPVKVGDTISTHDGEKVTLTGWSEPYDGQLLKEGFAGDITTLNLYRGAKIYCKQDGQEWQNQWYPTVCNLRFVVVA